MIDNTKIRNTNDLARKSKLKTSQGHGLYLHPLLTPRGLGYLTVLFFPFVCLLLAIVILWNHFVGPNDIVLLIALYLATGLGVSVGYHRLLTHCSFRTYPSLRYTLAILGSMAAEGPPSEWVATHRKHHAFADRPGDPHSPHEGGPGLLEQSSVWLMHTLVGTSALYL